MIDLEPEGSCKSEHARIGRSHESVQQSDVAFPAVVDELLEQDPAEPLPLKIGTNDDGKLRAAAVDIRARPYLADDLRTMSGSC